jgi:hypothetical protein
MINKNKRKHKNNEKFIGKFVFNYKNKFMIKFRKRKYKFEKYCE